MADMDPRIAEKIGELSDMIANEIGLSVSLGVSQRFKCGDYECTGGEFTCSKFRCTTSAFKTSSPRV